jgi:PadR family transcriptional regulator, regulatory protein PadR
MKHLNQARASPLGAVEFQILRTVSNLGSSAYGAAIQRHLASITGRELPLGQIYTALDRLEAKGLVCSKRTSPEPVRGGRAKRVFQMEDRGVVALERAAATYTMIAQLRELKDHGKQEPIPEH